MNAPADAQRQVAAALADGLRSRGLRLATAESCTGGLIGAACTALPGSSDWFECGFVVYSNEAKTELLGVPASSIAEHGAVSEVVAKAMAEGALRRSRAQLSVAVTGVAGPGGATATKPVGTVWLAVSRSAALAGGAPCTTTAARYQFSGDRDQVRQSTVTQALRDLLDALG